MRKSQKKALQFAYDLMRGRYRGAHLTYVYATVPKDLRGQAEASPAPWIEPDRDPHRPYLNEAVLSSLAMRGYMEVKAFEPGPVWLYRLSRQGCAVMGWTWPTHTAYPLALKNAQHARLVEMLQPPRSQRYSNGSLNPHRRLSFDPHRFRRSNDWRKR